MKSAISDANWSWAISCAKTPSRFHFRLRLFYFFRFSSCTRRRISIFEDTPTIRDKTESQKWIHGLDKHAKIASRKPWVFLKCVRVSLCGSECRFWMAQKSFSSVVNYNIASLSTAITAVYNESRASVRFGRQDGKTRNFYSTIFVRYRSWSKAIQRNNNFNVPWKKLFASFVLIKTPLIYERDYKTINSLVVP